MLKNCRLEEGGVSVLGNESICDIGGVVDKGECEGLVKLKVGSSTLIREVRAGVSGVEREVHYW